MDTATLLSQKLKLKWNRYIPCSPSNKQLAFLLLSDIREVFYGGSAGGGKSISLLMGALQYVDIPRYSALIIRRTLRDLSMPGGLLDVSKQWLMPYVDSGVKWDEQKKTWTFPEGGRIVFGYMDSPNDHYQYQGSELQYVGFDEASQLRWSQVQYLWSRLRRVKTQTVPLRIRMASNPGGPSHDELKARYIDTETRVEGAVFIPATMDDNPYLDKVTYTQNLLNLDPLTREQLMAGNWDAIPGGELFQPSWFQKMSDVPAGKMHMHRFWDLAATEESVGKDPDWTAGVKGFIHEKVFYIVDVRRVRARPSAVERFILKTAEEDGLGTSIWMEQEPGSAGVAVCDSYAKLLFGYSFHADKVTGDKMAYARPLSAAAEQGRVKILRANWNSMFLDELAGFGVLPHDDMGDAASRLFNVLTKKKKKAGVWF
jgi:predicted phage terminase large subunit-like protein